MISDVLSDAGDEIKQYLRFFPEVYEPKKKRLEKLLNEMDAIRAELDKPPKE